MQNNLQKKVYPECQAAKKLSETIICKKKRNNKLQNFQKIGLNDKKISAERQFKRKGVQNANLQLQPSKQQFAKKIVWNGN